MKIVLSKNNKKVAFDVTYVTLKDAKKMGIDKLGFEGKSGQFRVTDNELIVGTTGAKKKSDWRELGQKVTAKLISLKVKKAYTSLNDESLEFIEGLILGSYEFTKYKSEKKKNKQLLEVSIEDITVFYEAKNRVLGQFCTRDLVNTTPEDANPESLQKLIHKKFKNSEHIDVTVYYEKDLKHLGMNGHLAVNRASRHKAYTVKLEYRPSLQSKDQEHHIFVGKGLTFDSGGLDIKGDGDMKDMKSDKAGAMTLVGLFDYLENSNVIHNVTAYIALAENMIDGTAYKSDDVLTMKNGKTVHIRNTDAEGRIVLFDNLCLAEEENKKITTIHSLATLTGAAVYQFDGACGLVGFNDDLKKKIMKKGRKSGEIYMDAAFHTDMMDGVDDKLADLSNTGTPNAGCQKAGLFLTNALTKKAKKKYLHHDIAGCSFKQGFATGFGVRTLINFLKD